jgi:hypothetical protein
MGTTIFFLTNNDLGKPLNKMGRRVKYCVPGITLGKPRSVYIAICGWALVQVPQDDFGDFEDAN